MLLGVAVKTEMLTGAGRVTLTGPLPVPIGTEQTDREAFNPRAQKGADPYAAATDACRSVQEMHLSQINAIGTSQMSTQQYERRTLSSDTVCGHMRLTLQAREKCLLAPSLS